MLPGDGTGRIDLGSEVVLTALKLAKTSEGAIDLERGTAEIKAIYDGRGPAGDDQREHLSTIIKVLNERFGLQLTLSDQLLFDQFEQGWLTDANLAAQARANSLDNFRLVFQPTFMRTIVRRMDDNTGIFRRINDDPEFQSVVMDHYLRRVFERARTAGGAPTV